MLNRLNAYFEDSKKKMKGLFSSAKDFGSKAGLCSISITPSDFAIVFAHKSDNKILIELCRSYPYSDVNQLNSTIVKIVKQYHLEQVPCALVLQPEEYQILITDSLPVPPSEFQSAIRFKVKDHIHYPMNDVVIDSFPIPKTKVESENKIMLIAAVASRLVARREQLKACGLQCRIIDIPELALRNIMALFEVDEKSTALIYLQEKTIQLLISYKKQLYVSRNVTFSLGTPDLANNAETVEQDVERLASEIQRSLDFYYSQWREVTGMQILLASTVSISNDVIELLSKRLNNPIKILNLTDVLALAPDIDPDALGKYLAMIGELAREES